jgi:carbon monoxide dehydrogenase subunit G
VELSNEFVVPASDEQTWAFLNDLERVVPCMPGASMTEIVDEDEFRATMGVKLGAAALQFDAVVDRHLDAERRALTLNARARERRGRGGAQARIAVELEPATDGTLVKVSTDLRLQGAVVGYSRGLVPDVARQLTDQFALAAARAIGGEEQ